MDIRTLPANTKGRDFICGDLHGMYDLLIDKLEEANFDFCADRLFSVGDLIDRGPRSLDCIRLLENDWFYAVKGNHESRVLDFLEYGRSTLLMQNGGGWFFKLSTEEQNYVYDLITTKMVDQIETPDFIVTHAYVNEDNWNRDLYYLARSNERDFGNEYGVKPIYVGHNPVDRVRMINNHIMLDTGACFRSGYLTVMEHV